MSFDSWKAFVSTTMTTSFHIEPRYLERMFKRIDLKDAGKLSLDQLVQAVKNLSSGCK